MPWFHSLALLCAGCTLVSDVASFSVAELLSRALEIQETDLLEGRHNYYLPGTSGEPYPTVEVKATDPLRAVPAEKAPPVCPSSAEEASDGLASAAPWHRPFCTSDLASWPLKESSVKNHHHPSFPPNHRDAHAPQEWRGCTHLFCFAFCAVSAQTQTPPGPRTSSSCKATEPVNLHRVGTVGSALCPPQTLPARSSRPAANAAAEVDWRRPEYGPTVPFALSPKQQQEAWGDQPPTLDGLAEGCGSVFFSATVCEHSFRFFFLFFSTKGSTEPHRTMAHTNNSQPLFLFLLMCTHFFL